MNCATPYCSTPKFHIIGPALCPVLKSRVENIYNHICDSFLERNPTNEEFQAVFKSEDSLSHPFFVESAEILAEFIFKDQCKWGEIFSVLSAILKGPEFSQKLDAYFDMIISSINAQLPSL